MKNNMRILFMGTPILAAEILEFLIINEFKIVGVVSQPDRGRDRKGNVIKTPVKEVALKYNIKVFQPEKIRDGINFLEEVDPNIVVTAAYGQIIPENFLNYPEYGCINVHGSLLPKYRGGAPMHYAILNGDKSTGVTIMEMVKEMDAGPIISQEEFPIEKKDTLLDVHNKMIEVGKSLLVKTLFSIIDGSFTKTVQDEKLVTYSPTIKKEEQKINFNARGVDIYNKIRAFNPWPTAYAIINGIRIKLYEVEFEEKKCDAEIGQIVKICDEGIFVCVNGGLLKILEMQIEGRRKMSILEFIHGNNFFVVRDKFE